MQSGVVEHLGRRLSAHLRRMDAEAVTVTASGQPAGLCDYGRHVHPEQKRPQAEPCWSARLAELLSADGYAVECERPYPAPAGQRPARAKRRDLYVTAGGGAVSVEVKGAWSDYWGRRNRTYLSYLLHPLVPNLDRTKRHTVPSDLGKLSTLRPSDTDVVAQLLVGFEDPADPMGEDVRRLIASAGLHEWQQLSDAWESGTVAGQWVRCWLWFRIADGRWSVTVQ